MNSNQTSSRLSEEAKETMTAFLKGILLVLIQLFTLSWHIIIEAFQTLAKWGARGKLPSSGSDFPVITFMIIDLKPFAIIITCLFAVLAAIPTYGLSLLVGYISIPLISYSFEIVAMFISAVNSLKRIEKK